MAEPKLLPPSMRAHKRYVVFEIIPEKPVEYGDFMAAFWSSLLNLLGENGAADARIWVIKNLFDDKQQRGVVKCQHDFVEYTRASLMMVQIIGETKAIVRVLGVTGTIKSAKDKYLGIRDLRDFSKSDGK